MKTDEIVDELIKNIEETFPTVLIFKKGYNIRMNSVEFLRSLFPPHYTKQDIEELLIIKFSLDILNSVIADVFGLVGQERTRSESYKNNKQETKFKYVYHFSRMFEITLTQLTAEVLPTFDSISAVIEGKQGDALIMTRPTIEALETFSNLLIKKISGFNV